MGNLHTVFKTAENCLKSKLACNSVLVSFRQLACNLHESFSFRWQHGLNEDLFYCDMVAYLESIILG